MIRKKKPFIFLTFKFSHIYLVLSILIMTGLVCLLLKNSAVWVTVPLPSVLSGKTIAIDAGHGGRDPGAIGRSGLKEKDVTLDLAKRLKRLFSRVGVYVVMTREEDVDYSGEEDGGYTTKKRRDLIYRTKMINRSKADLLLSIHVNSFPQSIWSGAQCFYDTVNPDSESLAKAIQEELVKRLGPNRRRAKAADYMILKNTNIPSAIVEVGFISNPREEQLLAAGEYRERLAEAIFSGTIRYFCEKWRQEPVSPVGTNLTGKVYPELPPPPPASGQVRLYFAAPNNEDLELWPEDRELALTGNETPTTKGEKILRELFRGPGVNSALLPCMPPGDWIRGFQVKKDSAVVDLKREVSEAIDGGGASELLALYSLVNTLTENLSLEEVTILVDGENGSTLGGHVLLDQPVKARPDLLHREN